MKNKILYLLYLLIGTYAVAQKISVVDSIDSKPIPYAEFIVNGNSYFSDSLGNFTLSGQAANITLRKNGYESKNIGNAPSEVKLRPKYIEIPEVTVKKRKDHKFINQPLKKNTTKLPVNLTVGYLLTGHHEESGFLKEITIRAKRIFNHNSILKIDFYGVENQIIESVPLNRSSIIVPLGQQIEKESIKINVSRHRMLIDNKVLISLRVIDETGSNENVLKEPSVQFYNSKSIDSVYFFDNIESQWKELSSNQNQIAISYTVAY